MSPLFVFFSVIALVLNVSVVGQAATWEDLPIPLSAKDSAVLLDLGQAIRPVNSAISQAMGEVVAHQGDTSIQYHPEEIEVLHPGFGSWSTDFRFKLPADFTAKTYTFWARWRQGGDPNVCIQTFEIWAGPSADKLVLRGRWAMKPKGWDYAWVAGDVPLNLHAEDRVVEVRNSGAGHDAKVFDAFLLASPLASLPAIGSAEKPLALLELGQTPALAMLEKAAYLQVQSGSASGGAGAESVLTEKDEVQVFHQGFGDWGASFQFDLNPALTPGQYRVYARYKSGGEVSQVQQHFSVKAGTKTGELARRGDFSLLNSTPWEYQWLAADTTINLLPGDRRLEISNTGKADGAKVFDAFLLQLQTPLGDWLDETQAQARNQFLARIKPQAKADRQLYLLDGKGDHAEILFRGLAAAGAVLDNLAVSYRIGAEAEAMAASLNLPSLPAAVISDDHFTVLGVLSQPKDEAAVLKFIADPVNAGAPLKPAAIAVDAPKPLNAGVPAAWLVGGLHDGLAGEAALGLDGESVLRPNPDQPYLSLQMMGAEIKTWKAAPTQADSTVDIEAHTSHSYGWSRGSGYAQLYLHVDQATSALLHLRQSGIKTAAWLDGHFVSLVDDPKPPAGLVASTLQQAKNLLQGLTTEGLVATAIAEKPESPQLAALRLSPGWHSLLIKLSMQHGQGQRFYFSGTFSDDSGKPLAGVNTQLTDPGVDLALNKIAARLRPLVFVDAPANLPHVGDSLKLRVDMRWHPLLEETALSAPLLGFSAKLRLRLVDYAGHELAVREATGLWPGQVEMDFGKTPAPGFYAVYASLYSPGGQLIMNYPADGFSVLGGNAEQKQRLQQKKLWNNDYYALADGDKSFHQDGGYFNWLERMGIFKSYGSYPGFDAQYLSKWQQAQQRGLLLFADASGDSVWLNDKPEDGQAFINAASSYSRFFKSSNEIDIRHEAEWQKLREPAHWVARAKSEYQQIHRQRGDGHYVGGSLVRPADGDWFKQVLQLGLDQYHDAWDVHAYPQHSPVFGGPIGNGTNEDERGVLAVYASLGRANKLPFWLGETGAKATHGWTGRRWQAEQVAKMIAWTNSRADYLGLAFCIGHEYDLAYGRIWDYSMGHKPGEAALYSASALIDGLTYRAVDSHDANIQAAYFGDTLMVWRSDAANSDWRMKLDPSQAWLLVDVVGHAESLSLDADGNATVAISSSPVYVLTQADYRRLTR